MPIPRGANNGGWFFPVYAQDEAPDAPSESDKALVFAQLDGTGQVALYAINSEGTVIQLSANNDFLAQIAQSTLLTQELLEELRIMRAALVSMATEAQRVQERDLLAEANVPRNPVSH